jgi:hypothetical protein
VDANRDFEDMLRLLGKHRARYVIVGGLAVIYHAKPRYTKDMDLLVEPSARNVARVNRALAEFGSPFLLSPDEPDQIVQIGVAPHRIDLLCRSDGVSFAEAWRTRVRDYYGGVRANWIGLHSLVRAKACLPGPRHREDVRVLLKVKQTRRNPRRRKDR